MRRDHVGLYTIRFTMSLYINRNTTLSRSRPINLSFHTANFEVEHLIRRQRIPVPHLVGYINSRYRNSILDLPPGRTIR